MGNTVVIAEKPSVGRDIARVLKCTERGDGCLKGNGYIVTWAVGHLVTLSEPDELDEKYKKWNTALLPILPSEIPLKVIPATRSQYKIVKDLINHKDTDSLICATDAGREGELIFRYIYEKSGCRKPFSRLWISSMTDEAIQEGFRSIRPGADYDGLYASARCRSEADWLVGMNATRAFTLRYNVLLSVGRVQTPTLAILVKRRKEIEEFKPEGFHTVTADFGDYSGILFDEKLTPDTHIAAKEDADRIAAEVKGKEGTVLLAETTRKKELPPQLYDLTSLQRDANRLLGYTADKTLKLAQSLYEKHKALTYPRTDSRYIPPDMIPKVVQTMRNLPQSYQGLVPGALPDGKPVITKRTVDASKVTDHHAILPTTRRADVAAFTADEARLYDLVARRMLQAFYPPCEYDATRVITGVGEYRFRTKGRVVISNGWRDVPTLQDPPKAKKKTKAADDEDETQLPALNVGDTRKVKNAVVKEDMTRPPSPHTDASLLSSMETAGRELEDEELVRQMKGSGIGTPATRAAIIERLLQVGYAQRKGKTILATDKGVQLIGVVPGELSSPEMTGRWELALHDITDGKQDAERFMEGIRRFSAFLVDYAGKSQARAEFPREETRGKGKRGNGLPAGMKKVEGTVCPLCGKGPVTESDKGFSCSCYRDGCRFTVWKDCLTRAGGPELNTRIFTLLLEKREVKGSTGVIRLEKDSISFTPAGQGSPAVSRPLIWNRGLQESK